MGIIQLTKQITLPSTPDALQREPLIEKHERWLRILIAHNRTPIYMGDSVKVSDRWASDKGNNPHRGKTGRVIGLECGPQAAFNIEYLIYTLAPEQGANFQAYQYTLDRTHQTDGNRLAEKLLGETNEAFARAFP